MRKVCSSAGWRAAMRYANQLVELEGLFEECRDGESLDGGTGHLICVCRNDDHRQVREQQPDELEKFEA
jgi:hypothetical protein